MKGAPNLDQFLNKHYLLSAQNTGTPTPIVIIVTQTLPKAPNTVIASFSFVLSGYLLYLNFDPEDYNLTTSDIMWSRDMFL